MQTILPFWIGPSRLEAARLAERERCAQVPEQMAQELATAWTERDDFSPGDIHRRAMIAKLHECARRIRDRGEKPKP